MMRALATVLALAAGAAAGRRDPATFTAAVLEFAPETAAAPDRTSAWSLMRQNIASADALLAGANATMDIAVLPEYGLYGIAFVTREGALPFGVRIPARDAPDRCACGDEVGNPLCALASVARRRNVTLVANLVDQQEDPDSARALLFNTDVALGPDGCVLAKYHKFNLYGEQAVFDRDPQPQPVAFDAPFGVRFGLFVCFDVLFAAPTRALVRELGVAHAITSSWWVNFPPLMLATQVQSAWARAYGVTLLAANSGASWRSSGSGIYWPAEGGGQHAITTFNPGGAPRSSLLLATLPLAPAAHAAASLPVSPPPLSSSLQPAIAPLAPPHTPPPPRPWAVSVVPLAPDGAPTTASANLTVCTATAVGATPVAANYSVKVVAARGWYHDLFYMELCAVLPCATDGEACLDALPTLRAGVRASELRLAAEFVEPPAMQLAAATAPGGALLAEDACNCSLAVGAGSLTLRALPGSSIEALSAMLAARAVDY